MRIKVAITVALALSVVGGGCSRPWQLSTADLAPLKSQPYEQKRYSNLYDPPSQYPDPYVPSRPRYSDRYAPSQYGRASSSNQLGPVSDPNPPPVVQSSSARKVKTITIPAPGAPAEPEVSRSTIKASP
jgi:hypothetical protein